MGSENDGNIKYESSTEDSKKTLMSEKNYSRLLEMEDSEDTGSTKLDSSTEDSKGEKVQDSEDDANSVSSIEDIFVQFPAGNQLKSYKLIQLEDYPTHENKSIKVNSDVVLMISHEAKRFASRGHMDGWDWMRMSKGVGNKTMIGTNKCMEKIKNCPAFKRKWVCNGNCEFKNNFFCDYLLNEEREALILLYDSKHNHRMKNLEEISIEDYVMESKLEILSKSKKIPASNFEQEDHLGNDNIDEPPVPNLNEILENHPSGHLNESLKNQPNENENLSGDVLKWITKIVKAKSKYRDSKIVKTAKTRIKENEMTDTFHIIEKNPDERAFDVSKDGYFYNRHTSTKDFPVIFKKQQLAVYTCTGRMKCINAECDVFRRIQCLSYIANKPSTSKRCLQCSSNLVLDQCSGKRWIISSSEKESGQEATYCVVYYQHSHSCGKQDWVLDPKVLEDLGNLFKTNSSLTSAAAFNNLLNEKFNAIMREDNTITRRAHFEDLLAVVNGCTFDHVPKNIKAKVIKAKTPNGTGIEAIMKLKEKVDEAYDTLGIAMEVVIDSYVCEKCYEVVYSTSEGEEMETKCCGDSMVQTGASVMVTSKEQMKIALEMSKKDGIFSRSTAFADHQPGRCDPMNTFNLAMYDHTLMEMASLFMAHTMSEDQYSVSFQFKLFDDLLQKFNGSGAKFDPFGFCSDQGGGLVCGIRNYFGPDKPHRTCKFHFIYSAYQYCGNSIGDHADKIVFLKFSYALSDASTVFLFAKVSEEFWNWILKLETRYKQLKNWWNWWFNCRTRWSQAFTNPTLAETNQVEAIQAKYSKKNGMKNLSLLHSVIGAVGDSLKYTNRLYELAKGKYRGRGPSQGVLESRELVKQMERVKNIALSTSDLHEIFDSLGLPFNAEHVIGDISDVDERSLPKNYVSSPLIRESSERGKVLNSFTPSPISKSTFHKKSLPKKLDFKGKARKPGRPPGSKSKKFVSRWSSNDFVDDDEDPDMSDESDDVAEKLFAETAGEIFDSDDEFGCELTEVLSETEKRPDKSMPNEVLFNLDLDDVDRQIQIEGGIKTFQNGDTEGSSRLRQRLFDTIHFNSRKQRAYNEQKNYTVQQIDLSSYNVIKKDESHYQRSNKIRKVEFNIREVLCSCEDYTKIRYQKNSNEVCKHIALIILKCDPGISDLYYGTHKLTNKDAKNLQSILETFSSSRKIENPSVEKPKERKNKKTNKAEKLSKFSTLQFPQKGLFETKEQALGDAPENPWYAEKYSVGGHPKCRTCSKPIQQLQNCLRTDVAYCIVLPTNTNGWWSLKSDIIRFCLNDVCHRNLPRSKLKNKKFDKMKKLSLKHIDPENKEVVTNIFVDSVEII